MYMVKKLPNIYSDNVLSQASVAICILPSLSSSHSDNLNDLVIFTFTPVSVIFGLSCQPSVLETK